MEVNLEGKINNLSNFYDHALLPVFEAIINSIHAIQDRKNGRGTIIIKIVRDKTISTNLFTSNGDYINDLTTEKKEKMPEILDFIIEDDGIGFTSENFQSFNISDSIYKKNRGGRGIGRFSWLKAFDKVEISSVYDENGERQLRVFDFTTKTRTGIDEKPITKTKSDIKTTIKLLGFKKGYRNNPSAFKTTSKIAQRILEHFISYYINESVPQIIVEDKNIKINLDNEFDEIKNHIFLETIQIKGREFKVYHVELPHTKKDLHQIVYCADGRDVSAISINNLLGTSAFVKDNQKIYYASYIFGDYLTSHVDSLRRGFDFSKTDYKGADGKYEISEETLKNEIINCVKIYLSDYLMKIQEKKKEQVSNIIKDNPTLRTVPFYYPNVYDEIKPTDTDKQALEVLYKRKGDEVYKTHTKYQNLLKTQIKSYAEIAEKCKEVTNELDKEQKNNLAQYMVWRKLVLQLLEKNLNSDDLDKYKKESIIHDILFPRYSTTDQISLENLNLWIIDDTLIFHNFAASEPRLKDIADTDSTKRPDFIFFSEGDPKDNANAVSIFELKRPMRERNEKDPIQQLIDYVKKARNNNIIREPGRPLQTDSNTKYYCYWLCDVLDEVKEIAESYDMDVLKHNMGYRMFHKSLNAQIQIISYNHLIKEAQKRHYYFFEKLNIEKP